MSEFEKQDDVTEEAFIGQDSIAQVVEVADDDEPMSEDEHDPEDGHENHHNELTLELDLSNNSSLYFDSHQDSIFLTALHPTLPLAITGGGDNVAYVWRTDIASESEERSAKLVTVLNGFTESVIAGGFTHDGSYIVCGDMTGQVRVWKSFVNGEKWQFYDSVQEVDDLVAISFHPKQSVFAVMAVDGSVWCYSLEPRLEIISVLYSHTDAVNFGVFVDTDNVDALTLLTGSDDGTIVCWNVYNSSANFKIEPEKSNILGGELHPWVAVAPSPSGKSAAVTSSDGFFIIVKLDDGTLLHVINTGESLPEGLDASDKSLEAVAWADGINVVAVGNIVGNILLYEVGTWKLRRILRDDLQPTEAKNEDAVDYAAITKLAFVPKTPYLVSSGHDGTLYKWDVRNGTKLWEGKGHSSGILGFSMKGDTLVTGDNYGVSLVFEIPK